MTEQWSRWEPVKGLSSRYWLESILDTMEGFELLLSDASNRNKKVRIIFENSVDSYKSTNETFKVQLFSDLSAQYDTDFYGNWTFFKIVNSSYIKSLLEESGRIADAQALMHFSIFEADSVIDIIAGYEPKVQLIGKSGN